ncbi:MULTISPECIES: hypothetical protein [Microbacterium]|uniref:hypothetical protein n=1 Tax=Microbacterium TaxID=33882 RepID=UPI0013A55684|nr:MULTISPECIES: hypothetical protein [Microbacterium]
MTVDGVEAGWGRVAHTEPWADQMVDIERVVTLASAGRIEMRCYTSVSGAYVVDFSLVAMPIELK